MSSISRPHIILTLVVAGLVLASGAVAGAENQAPVLAEIGPQSVNEGLNLNFGVSATDADGDSLILTVVDEPTNATFSDNYDETGIFDFSPDFTQAGVYDVTFIASDGILADTEIVAITVVNQNRSPELETIPNQTVTTGFTLRFEVSASDPDGTIPDVEVVSFPDPDNMAFIDHGDGTGTFEYSPDLDITQEVLITVKASDGLLWDNQTVHIRVYVDPGQPDSVIVDLAGSTRYDNDSLVIPIIVSNDQALVQLSIPLYYYSPDDYWLLDTDHVFWESTRFSLAPIKGLEDRSGEQGDSLIFLIYALEFSDSMDAGRDVIATLHFFKNPALPPESTPFGSLCIEATLVFPSTVMLFTSPGQSPVSWHPRIVGRIGDQDYVAVPACTLLTGILAEEEETGVPHEYELLQNYPNPFNAGTRIDFTLEKGGVVDLVIFNILGQRVAAPIARRYLDAGRQSTIWDGRDADGQRASSGIYFYRLTAAGFVEMKKMVLIK